MSRRHRRASLAPPVKVVTLPSHSAPVRFVRSDPGGKYILTAPTNGPIHVVSPRTRQVERTIGCAEPGYDDSLRDILFLNVSTVVFLSACNGLIVCKNGKGRARTDSGLPSDPLSLASVSTTEFLVACTGGEVLKVRVLKDGITWKAIFRFSKKIDRVIPGWSGFATIAYEEHSYLIVDREGNMQAAASFSCPGRVVQLGQYFNLSYALSNYVLISHAGRPDSRVPDSKTRMWYTSTSWQRIFIANDQHHAVLMSEDEVDIVRMSDNSMVWKRTGSGFRSADISRGGNLVVGCEGGKVLEFVLPNWLGVLLDPSKP